MSGFIIAIGLILAGVVAVLLVMPWIIVLGDVYYGKYCNWVFNKL